MGTLVDYRTFNHTPEIVKLRYGGVPYPDHDSYEILGNVLTPRIYGKDLSVFEVASSGRIALTVNDIYSLDVSRKNDTSNVTIATNNNDTLTMASSNTVAIEAGEIIAKGCNLDFKSSTATFSNQKTCSFVSENLSFVSTSNITLNTNGTSLSSMHSNVTWKVANDWIMQCSNNVSFQSTSNIIMNSGSKAFVTMVGSTGNVDVRGDQIVFSTNNAASVNRVLSIYREPSTGHNVVKVDGNLIITGTFETQDVLNTNLNINDKIIQVAYPGNNAIPNQDGPLNDNCGIQVNGVVSGTKTFNTDAEKTEFYKKGLLWRYGQGGVDLLGTAGGVSPSTLDLNESYWDVRGGGMMFTSCKQDSATNTIYNVSYGFRINEHDQFELYKRVRGANGAYVIKRISRWGGGAPIIL